ncbi:hypothetical protein ACRAWG_01150 [Methylobacterium sp. P31]
MSTEQLGDRLISAIGGKHLVSTSVRTGQPDEFEILIDEEVVTVTPALSADNQICSIGIDTGSRSTASESLAVLRTILELTEAGLGPQKADYAIDMPGAGSSAGSGPVLQKSELKFSPNKQGGYLISVSAK